jgi:putative flippase GtrA
MQKHRQLLRQIILFGLVGGGSLLTDVCVTTVLYNYAHLPPYLSGVIGFMSAFFFNFPLNRKHVFNHTKHDRFSLRAQVTFYISLSLFNLFTTGLLMQLMVGKMHIQISLAKVCVTGVIAVWNFFILKFIIFAKLPPPVEVERLILQ